MAYQLASSLVQRGRFDVADIRRPSLHWWQAEGFDTGPVAADSHASVGRRTACRFAVKPWPPLFVGSLILDRHHVRSSY